MSYCGSLNQQALNRAKAVSGALRRWRTMCIALLDALGVQFVVVALYQWFD